MPAPYSTDAERWAALRRRDPAADGRFLYSVATTGVYCHPSCAARPARPENVSFHQTRAEAERAGFRACLRCQPDAPPRAEREAAAVAAACRALEDAEPPPLRDLAARAGLGEGAFHRLFRRVAGVTPAAYARAHRARRVADGLRAGAGVTEALYDAGFNSSGRFYEAADGMLGMTPTAFRAGGAGQEIAFATAPCSLGHVLVARTERGVCAILLGDDPAALAADLLARFPRATLREDAAALAGTVASCVALVDRPGGGRSGATSLPLDIQGTAFQRRVWEALRAIPPGETRSYAQLAATLGSPGAARAVASACASNKVAVAVPCHRVVASDGSLAGYRWGVERKRSLLEREKA